MFEKYDAYKDSGDKWIGEIPTDWFNERLGTILEPISIKGNADKDLLSITREKGVILRDVEDDSENHNFIPDDLSNYKLIEKGQFGMNKMKAWQGSYGVSPYTGIVSPAYYIFRFIKPIYPDFFHWAIRSKTYISFFGSASDGVRIGQWDLSKDRMKNIPFVFPNIDSQKKIVEFIQDKAGKIDQAIAIKEQQIALLNEHKQIVIQKAVTQGLDPNVTMKDSGVEWIGQIPEHWLYEPIKYSLKGIVDCEHKTAPFVDEPDFFVIRTSNVKNGKLVYDDAKYTHEKGYNEWTRRGVPTPGDVLLTREAPAGEACLVPHYQKVCLGQRMVWLKINNERVLSQFILYLIYSNVVRTYIDFLSAGSTVLHFNIADIQNIPVLIPPLEEQKHIVQYLDKVESEINDSSEIIKLQIAKLKEYKTTLINDAVTGKIKVV